MTETPDLGGVLADRPIENFQTEFKGILDLIKELRVQYGKVSKSVLHLKTQYSEMVKTNNKKIFFFSLDSFFHQYKIYSLELEQIDKSNKMVNNRIYTEYYKLFQIIQKYVEETGISYDVDSIKKYPQCKELEPFHEYEIEDIEHIYGNILLLIGVLYEHLEKNCAETENYNKQHNVGFSISNVIITLKSENLFTKNQIDLFSNYIMFFLSQNKRQLGRIYKRLIDLLSVIEEGTESPSDVVIPVPAQPAPLPVIEKVPLPEPKKAEENIKTTSHHIPGVMFE